MNFRCLFVLLHASHFFGLHGIAEEIITSNNEYLIVCYSSTYWNWHESEAYCHSGASGHLARITSDHNISSLKQDLIINKQDKNVGINHSHTQPHYNVWIGSYNNKWLYNHDNVNLELQCPQLEIEPQINQIGFGLQDCNKKNKCFACNVPQPRSDRYIFRITIGVARGSKIPYNFRFYGSNRIWSQSVLHTGFYESNTEYTLFLSFSKIDIDSIGTLTKFQLLPDIEDNLQIENKNKNLVLSINTISITSNDIHNLNTSLSFETQFMDFSWYQCITIDLTGDNSNNNNNNKIKVRMHTNDDHFGCDNVLAVKRKQMGSYEQSRTQSESQARSPKFKPEKKKFKYNSESINHGRKLLQTQTGSILTTTESSNNDDGSENDSDELVTILVIVVICLLFIIICLLVVVIIMCKNKTNNENENGANPQKKKRLATLSVTTPNKMDMQTSLSNDSKTNSRNGHAIRIAHSVENSHSSHHSHHDNSHHSHNSQNSLSAAQIQINELNKDNSNTVGNGNGNGNGNKNNKNKNNNNDIMPNINKSGIQISVNKNGNGVSVAPIPLHALPGMAGAPAIVPPGELDFVHSLQSSVRSSPVPGFGEDKSVLSSNADNGNGNGNNNDNGDENGKQGNKIAAQAEIVPLNLGGYGAESLNVGVGQVGQVGGARRPAFQSSVGAASVYSEGIVRDRGRDSLMLSDSENSNVNFHVNGNLKKRRSGKKKSKRDDVVEDGLVDVAYRKSEVDSVASGANVVNGVNEQPIETDAREKYGEMSPILEQQNADWKGKGQRQGKGQANGKEKEKKKVNAEADAKKKEEEKKKKIGNDDGRDRDVYGLEQVDEKKEDVKLEIELELDEKEIGMAMNDNNNNNNNYDNLNDNNINYIGPGYGVSMDIAISATAGGFGNNYNNSNNNNKNNSHENNLYEEIGDNLGNNNVNKNQNQNQNTNKNKNSGHGLFSDGIVAMNIAEDDVLDEMYTDQGYSKKQDKIEAIKLKKGNHGIEDKFHGKKKPLPKLPSIKRIEQEEKRKRKAQLAQAKQGQQGQQGQQGHQAQLEQIQHPVQQQQAMNQVNSNIIGPMPIALPQQNVAQGVQGIQESQSQVNLQSQSQQRDAGLSIQSVSQSHTFRSGTQSMSRSSDMKMEELGVTKGNSMQRISEVSEMTVDNNNYNNNNNNNGSNNNGNQFYNNGKYSISVGNKVSPIQEEEKKDANKQEQSDFVLNISSPSFFGSPQTGNNSTFTSNISLISFGNQDSQRNNIFGVNSAASPSETKKNSKVNGNGNEHVNYNNNKFSQREQGQSKAKQSISTIFSSEVETIQ